MIVINENNKYNVIIIGTGGHAMVISDILKLNGYNIIGYYDDFNKNNNELNILGRIEEININIPNYVCAIGDNNIRKNIINKYSNLNWINVIHPSAIISSNCEIGIGNIIMAGCIINSHSKIMNHTIINTNSNIDHHNIISNYAHIAPGCTLCGNVNIGELTLIGAGSIIKNNIKIESNNIIGSGSNIVKNILEKYIIAYGNPCKIMNKINNINE